MNGGYGSAASVRVLWLLPAHGDCHFLGTSRGARAIELAYFGQLAQAADNLRYYGFLVPTGKSCEDSWLVAAASFVLSGHPHLEEAYRFVELVMPLLPLAHEGPRRMRAVNTGPGSAALPNPGQRPAIRVARW